MSCLARWAVAQPCEQRSAPAGATAATVRELGAKGDHQADDTAALQQAADRGGEIRFVRGTYCITRPIIIDLERVGYTSIVGGRSASCATSEAMSCDTAS